MIKTNKEFLQELNKMLEKYGISVRLGDGPDYRTSFFSTVEKEIYINRYSDDLFIKVDYVYFVVTLMFENVKKINDGLGIVDAVFNKETKRYEFNKNIYVTLKDVYELYDEDDYSMDDFLNDERNKNTLDKIRDNEIKDRDIYNKLLDYFYYNIHIKGVPVRAWEVIEKIKPKIETKLKRNLTELENDLLVEFTCNKTLYYPLKEIEDGFNIKENSLYYHNEYLFGDNEPIIEEIKSNEEFSKLLSEMLLKYKITVKLARFDEGKQIFFDEKDNEIYININSKVIFLDYLTLILTLIRRNVMKINYNRENKDYEYNEDNLLCYNDNFYKTRLEVYGIHHSYHNEILHDERNAAFIEKIKQYERDDFITFLRLKEYYYKNIIGTSNAPCEYEIYLLIKKYAEFMFNRPLTRKEKTYLENYITFKTSYEPMEVLSGYHVDDGWLWHYYTRLIPQNEE